MGEFDQHNFEYCGIDISIANYLPDVTKKNQDAIQKFNEFFYSNSQSADS